MSGTNEGEMMTELPSQPTGADRLKQIAAQLGKGYQPEAVTVRELLRWFDAQRRGSFIVWWIRKNLSDAKLATQPDFEATWLDGQIRFISGAGDGTQQEALFQDAGALPLAAALARPDPTYRIGKLRSANTPPVSIAPNQTIAPTLAEICASIVCSSTKP